MEVAKMDKIITLELVIVLKLNRYFENARPDPYPF